MPPDLSWEAGVNVLCCRWPSSSPNRCWSWSIRRSWRCCCSSGPRNRGFWQSVTGSREPDDPDLEATARRELLEETGLSVGTLTDWRLTNRYEIWPQWRATLCARRDAQHRACLRLPGRQAPSRRSIRPSIRRSSGCPGSRRWRGRFRPPTATRSGNCRGGFSGILARHDLSPQGSLEARPVQLGPVRLGQPALLHRRHHLHLRALLRQRPGRRPGEGPGGMGFHAIDLRHHDRADEPVPRRHGRRRRPAQTLHLLFQFLLAVGCAALWFAYPNRPDSWRRSAGRSSWRRSARRCRSCSTTRSCPTSCGPSAWAG